MGHVDGGAPEDSQEKDKSSQKSTLGGTATPSKHRKDRTASEVAHSTSTEKPTRTGVKKASKSKKKKKSIWSKLATAFFHCTWSTDYIHDVDIDMDSSGVSDPSASLEPKEKLSHVEQSKEDAMKDSPTTEGTSGSTDQETTPKISDDDAVPLTIAPDLVPPPITDPAVVVPPSPSTQVRTGTEDPDGVTSSAVQPAGSTGREHGDESEDTSFTDDEMPEVEDEEERLINAGGAGIPIGADGVPRPLLPPIAPQHAGRKCLVLDLDETLVHSSFKVSSQ